MKKILKGKYAKSISCLGLGVVILSAAVFANYDNANGYTDYKNALKQIPFEENVSVDLTASLLYDGEEMASADMTYRYDHDGAISRADSTTETSADSRGSSSRSYTENGITYSEYTSTRDDGTQWHNVSADSYRYSNEVGLLGVSEEDQPVMGKMIRVVELMADAFVGDIKNNFVLTEKTDDSKSYSVSLTESQIPEIVNAGVSLVASSMAAAQNNITVNGGDYPGADLDRKMNEIMCNEQEPYVSAATCDLTLNAQGKLTANTLTGTLTGFDAAGAAHELTVKIDVSLYDYGTTEIQPMDFITGMPQVTMRDGSVTTVQALFAAGNNINGTLSDGTNVNFYDFRGSTGEIPEIFLVDGMEVSSDEYNVVMAAQAEEYNADLLVESESADAAYSASIDGTSGSGAVPVESEPAAAEEAADSTAGGETAAAETAPADTASGTADAGAEAPAAE